jgi:hypothetical protein
MEMKWHPISSVADNPKESGKYLVTVCERRFNSTKFATEVRNIHTMTLDFTLDEYGATWDRKCPYYPIAWTPLPAPYRPEGEV